MSDKEEVKAIVAAIREHLTYLSEIGVTEYGDETRAQPKALLEKNMAEQFSLFEMADEIRPRKDETLDEIRAEIGHCCKLCEGCTQPVFGDGNPKARLMFIGEAPGADEDIQGRPFVGAAGKLLDKIINAMGLKREEVYITNVVKCRPPGNRKPEKEEVEACEGFLFREIAAVKPRVIVTLGATPLFSLLRIKEGITHVRGNWYEYQKIPVMPTFHPAYLLRSPDKKREVWEDMKQVMARLKTL